MALIVVVVATAAGVVCFDEIVGRSMTLIFLDGFMVMMVGDVIVIVAGTAGWTRLFQGSGLFPREQEGVEPEDENAEAP